MEAVGKTSPDTPPCPILAVPILQLSVTALGSGLLVILGYKPERWRFFKQPGGLSEHAENREHLPDQYDERQVAGKDQDWVKVYVHGEYGYVRAP